LLAKLARILPTYRRLLDELRQTREALSSARRAAALSKARKDGLEQRVTRLRGRLAALTESNRALKSSLAARTLSPAVLEQSTLVRLDALRKRARVGADAAVEEDFAARSAAYRECRSATASPDECDGPIAAHGLNWWVPRKPTADPNSLEARVASGRLPFRTILATRELTQGSVMLDIGANVGTTCIPRVVLGDFQQVYAAEPEPANYACLVQNVVANGLDGLVMPDRVAIGSVDGDVTLELAPTMGAHRVVESCASAPGCVTVPARTLDTWIDSLAIDPLRIAFVKCDVQGWEARVLEGARRTLGYRHIAWQLEVSPKHLRHAGSSLSHFCVVVRRHFHRFIDLGADRQNRPTSELEASLGYLGVHRRFTDILVYNT
jgi:FkbM family methyltransferase